MTQNQRNKIFHDFRTGMIRNLVATGENLVYCQFLLLFFHVLENEFMENLILFRWEINLWLFVLRSVHARNRHSVHQRGGQL